MYAVSTFGRKHKGRILFKHEWSGLICWYSPVWIYLSRQKPYDVPRSKAVNSLFNMAAVSKQLKLLNISMFATQKWRTPHQIIIFSKPSSPQQIMLFYNLIILKLIYFFKLLNVTVLIRPCLVLYIARMIIRNP